MNSDGAQRSDDTRRGDRAGREKSPSRNQERQRNVPRDSRCWAGGDCSRLYDDTCRWQHTDAEHAAAAAYNAGGARGTGRSPGRQRIEQIEPAHPDEHPEQQRTARQRWSVSLTAVDVIPRCEP